MEGKLIFHLNQFIPQKRFLSYKRIMTWYSELWKPKPSNPPHKHIIQIGDPRLRTTSQPIPYDDIPTERIQRLIIHLKRIFKVYNCIGLAAPQVGMPLRLFIIALDEKMLASFSPSEQKNNEIKLIEPTVVINPEIKVTDYKKSLFSESCGSIKGFCAEVPRYNSIQLKGFNEFAEPFTMDGSGFTARIIQHEVDHLNGKLYTDVMDRKTLSCTCWDVVNQRNGKIELPYGPG